MSKGPLQGVRVVDLSHSWAGPHATRILAEYGAEVIRVEYPARLGMMRGGRTDQENYNHQSAWHQLNRNKLAMTLDLEQDVQRDILYDLVQRADVFFHNARPGVMEKLGFGYNELKQRKPSLIVAVMPAYGATGPLSDCAAYGAALEVMSGVQNLTAYRDGDKPERLREIDVVNGVGAAGAVLTAVFHLKRTGQGQFLDFSQLEFPSHSLIGEHLLEHAIRKDHAPALGNRHRIHAPQGCYPCQGEDRWVTLTIRSDREWHALCDALDMPGGKRDPRFASAADRQEHHALLDERITAWTSRHTDQEAVRILQACRVPAGMVLDTASLADDPHLADRAYFAEPSEAPGPTLMGLPVQFTRSPGGVHTRGPDLGAHNEFVVTELLGRQAEDVPTFTPGELRTAYEPEPRQAVATTDIEAHYDAKLYSRLYDEYMGGSDFANWGYRAHDGIPGKEASERLVDTLLDLLPKTSGTILDVACGKGATTRHLLNHYSCESVTALNISERQLEAARKNAPGCTFTLGDAVAMPYDDGSFDNIICVEAAFHFMTRERFLREACRVLKPGGHLVLSDVLLRTGAESAMKVFQVENSVTSIEAYEAVCQAAGFEVITTVDATRECWERHFWSATQFVHEKFLFGEIDRGLLRDSLSDLYRLAPHMMAYLLVGMKKKEE